jgi:hypothetical protein
MNACLEPRGSIILAGPSSSRVQRIAGPIAPCRASDRSHRQWPPNRDPRSFFPASETCRHACARAHQGDHDRRPEVSRLRLLQDPLRGRLHRLPVFRFLKGSFLGLRDRVVSKKGTRLPALIQGFFVHCLLREGAPQTGIRADAASSVVIRRYHECPHGHSEHHFSLRFVERHDP